jgi:prolyl oligopeptidase
MMLWTAGSLALAEDVVANDPHQWLEAVDSEEALDWVRARNDIAQAELEGSAGFDALQARLLEIYDSSDRIPYVGKRGDHFYNLWRDADHARGLWRRTTLESFRTDSPDWEPVLDLDALGEQEGENWVWKGSSCLPPEGRRCLLRLSRGGADAVVIREFDTVDKTFVTDGFSIPEAKGRAGWIDADTLFVATDFGEGSKTESGYPRIVKRWRRGTPLADAQTVFEGRAEDISVDAWHDHTPGFERSFVYQGTTFYTNRMFMERKGELVEVTKPPGAEASVHREWLFFQLRENWDLEGQVYAAGSLLVAPLDRWMKGKRKVEVLFEPTETRSLAGYSPTRHHVLLNVLEDVRNRVSVLTPGRRGWTEAPLEGIPEMGSVSLSAVDSDTSDGYFMNMSGYLTPSTLAYGEIGGAKPTSIKGLPEYFSADGLEVQQHFATSADGTRVPYFQVSRAGVTLDGKTPTLLYGYGGFEISLTPGYRATVGAAWLERGGAYVVANIRGGGEYGPRWHQAALREKRHRAYEDFIAVGEDLISRGVTSTPHLGIMGGSNGGLLMGNMLAMRPDLWGAVVCRVPLLDMQRFHLLLAGASWIGEYGDPDKPEDWAFMKTFSPYHLIKSDVQYPPMLLTTSTRDDRVHPGHARKMAARLLSWDKPVLYYENIEGGHGGAANNAQSAFISALAWQFLWNTIGPDVQAP